MEEMFSIILSTKGHESELIDWDTKNLAGSGYRTQDQNLNSVKFKAV